MEQSAMYDLSFSGRAKPVPPPRSHSLEQNNDKKPVVTAVAAEGNDHVGSGSHPSEVKNENLIAGKLQCLALLVSKICQATAAQDFVGSRKSLRAMMKT